LEGLGRAWKGLEGLGRAWKGLGLYRISVEGAMEGLGRAWKDLEGLGRGFKVVTSFDAIPMKAVLKDILQSQISGQYFPLERPGFLRNRQ
jgi:hypothetical protein